MESCVHFHAKLVCKAAAAFVLNMLTLTVFNFAFLNPDPSQMALALVRFCPCGERWFLSLHCIKRF